MKSMQIRRKFRTLRGAGFLALLAGLIVAIAPRLLAQSTDMSRPKIRALTAFINLDPAHYQDQVAVTLATLQKIKATFEVASLAYKWHKPLSARLLPVKGKKAGDRTDFQDPFLVNSVIQAVP
ncbi:MAG TPA: DUF711 family protein [Candidatus Acidoferrales bacterium]|nr:DUF711 family protein [Candidatus Acidoferrales bacterium]